MKNRLGITRFSWLAAMTILLSFLVFAGEARANYLFYNADTGREVFSNAVEAPSLYVLSGNIGIGTATPTGRLDISSATGSGSNNSLNIIGTGTGAQTWSLYPSTSQSLTLLRPGLRLATFLNDGGFAVGGLSDDIGSGADFYVNGTSGNVGIGTTAPSSKLEVVGSVLANTGAFRTNFPGTSTQTYHAELYEATGDAARPIRLRFHQGGRYWTRIEALNSQFYFKTGDTASEAYVTVNTGDLNVNGNGYVSGNVGVGVTPTTYGLDVRKAVTASGLVANGTNLQQTLTAAANNDVLSALKINPTFVPGAFTGVTQYAINATGTIKGAAFEGALSGTVNAGNVSSGSFGGNTAGGVYGFPDKVSVGYGLNSTPTTISQTGIMAVSGNVGIGTVAPTNRLHLAYPGVGNQVGIYFEDPTATAYGGRVYFDDTSNTFRVVTIENGVEVSGGLVINRTNGNVGIGTTVPGQKLEVYSGGNGDGILLRESFVGGSALASVFQNTGDGTGAALKLYDGSGNTKVNIDSGTGNNYFNGGGNVGIGTTTPSYPLDIQAATSEAFIKSTTGTNYAMLRINNTGGDLWFGRNSSTGGGLLAGGAAYAAVLSARGTYPIQFAVNNAAAMTIIDGGKVGIGTASPTQKLDVSGGTKLLTLNQGSGTNERFYPNVVSSAQDTTVAGAWIINTPIPRASNQMFRIRVHGYAYGNQDSIDFTIVGYSYSGAVGSVDGLGGAIVNYDLEDSGTDGLKKYVGVNSAGNLAIALGDETLSAYYYRISVDAWVTRTTTDYSTGWSVAQSIVSGFGFLDIKGPLTSSLKNTIFVNSTGNVGIGTSSPTVKLEVNGEIKGTAFSGGSYTGLINAGNVSSGTFGSNTGYGDYTFKKSVSPNNPILHIDAANGRVGVGTLTPTDPLSIIGDMRTTGNIFSDDNDFRIYTKEAPWDKERLSFSTNEIRIGKYLDNLDAGEGVLIVEGSENAATDTDVASLAFSNDSNAVGQTNAPIAKITANSRGSAGVNRGRLQFFTKDGTTLSPRMTITETGNAGINTETPGTTLDVNGVVNAATGYRVAGSASSGYFLRGNGTNFVSAQIQASDIPSGAIAAGTLSREDNRQISPSELTAGNLKFGFTTYRNDNGGVPYADFLHLRSYTDSSGGNDNLLVINKAALGMRVYQQAWGSVSAYTSYKDVVLADNTPAANYLTKYVGTGTNVSVGNSQIFDNGTSVGIGNTSPGAKLAVTGGVLIGNADAEQGYSLTWRGRNDLGIDEDGYSLVIGAPEGIRINLDSNNNATGTNFEIAKDVNAKTGGTVLFMVRESDGNVGIGTTSPAAGLDVQRAVTASGLVANGTNLQQTLTAAANNDVLSALKINPTFVPGAFTGVTQYAINATGTIKGTAFEGALAGTVSARNVSSGSFGGNTAGGVYGFPDKVSIGYGLDSTPTTISQTGNLAVSGNVGIGTVTPWAKLQVAAPSGTTNTFNILDSSSGYAWSFYNVTNGLGTDLRIYETTSAVDRITIAKGGYLGLGTMTPVEKLHVNGLIAVPLATATDNDSPGIIAVGSSNDDFLYDGEYLNHYGYGFHNYDDDGVDPPGTIPSGINSYVSGYFGIDFFTGGVSRMRIRNGGNVGIGITNPTYKLDVASAGAQTARLGTSSADTVLIGGGAGKLNVGTIDPIYTIGTKRYATYTTAMTGVKEETSGTIRLQKTGSRYMATLNFGSAEEGSDLWLFYQVTDFDSEWDGLSVLLSSGFDGSVWYEKDAAKKVIHIYGAPTVASALSSGELMEVSYRLTAPRFDHRKWSNYSEDEAEGFKLDVKE